MHKTPPRPGRSSSARGRVPDGVDAAVCPPFTSLAAAAGARPARRLRVYAQNMHQADPGRLHGRGVGGMLTDLGVHGVLLGHSERRQYYSETDGALAEKLIAAHEAGLEVIFAVGETDRAAPGR